MERRVSGILMVKDLKVVFLDRDGVINRRKRTLVKSWSEFVFLPGVKDAIRNLVENGYNIIVVTNQDVVGWGFISESKLREIHSKMSSELEASGAKITDIYYCPHNPMKKCSCRKPGPGMLKKAAEKYDLDKKNCWMVGDKSTDVQAGEAFGCRTILVKPNLKTSGQNNNKNIIAGGPDFVVKDLKSAVQIILKEDK